MLNINIVNSVSKANLSNIDMFKSMFLNYKKSKCVTISPVFAT